jgi:nitrite reductase/ring-hydroxylating ferredoxin subunit
LTGSYEGPGEHIKEEFSDELTIMCPWHGWEYYLETGEHTGDSSIVLESYDVVVEDDAVFIEL